MNPFAILMFIPAAACFILGFYCFRKGNLIGARTLGFLLLSITLWSTMYGLELLSSELETMRLFNRISYPGIATVPVFFFLFVMAVADRRKWFSAGRLFLLFLIPLFTVISMWTNEIHWFFYEVSALEIQGGFPIQKLVHGPLFWINISYTYLMLVAGILVLIREFVYSAESYRKQLSLILIGTLAPVLVNVNYIFRIFPVGYLDLTPVAFSIAAFFAAVSIFRFRILDLRPIARETIVESLQDGIVVIDDSKLVIDSNPMANRLLTVDDSNILGVHFEIAFRHIPGVVRFLGSNASQSELIHDNRIIELRRTDILGKRGKRRGSVLLLTEVTDRKRIEEALRKSEESLALAVKGGNIGLWDWKAGGGEMALNERYYQIMGYKSGELHLSFQEWKSHVHPEDLIPALESLYKCYNGDSDFFEIEYRMLSKTGDWIWVHDRGEVSERDEDGKAFRILGTHIDITSRRLVEEALRESQELYRKLATTDMLTGVMNRYSLNHILSVEMERAMRYGKTLSFIMFDLDDLKRINDTLGHLAGDTALKSVASFVSSRIRKSDSLGRWGGDEFLIVTPETDLKGAVDMAAKLQKGLRELEFPEIGELSISIGVSSKKENDSSYDDILRRADKALYESKARGKNTVTAI